MEKREKGLIYDEQISLSVKIEQCTNRVTVNEPKYNETGYTTALKINQWENNFHQIRSQIYRISFFRCGGKGDIPLQIHGKGSRDIKRMPVWSSKQISHLCRPDDQFFLSIRWSKKSAVGWKRQRPNIKRMFLGKNSFSLYHVLFQRIPYDNWSIPQSAEGKLKGDFQVNGAFSFKKQMKKMPNFPLNTPSSLLSRDKQHTV